MINIQKIGNAIVIDFTDNDKYLHDGTIEVAPNELMIVIDESDMATFKKMSNGDTLFGQLINQIQIQGEAVTKENIIDKFGMIGFASGGGAVDSVNGQTGEVVITAASLGAITKAEADATYAQKSELEEKQEVFQVNSPMSFNRDEATQDLHLSIDLSEYATKQDLDNKADKTSVYTTQEVNNKLATKQATLIQGTNITLSEPDSEGKVTISASQPDISGLATKEELATKADASALSSKQDTLVSETNIKTINGESILGSGNLTIQSGTQPRTWTFTTSSSITTGDSATITPSGFNYQEWLNQVAIGDMVYLDKGQEFMKLSVSNIYHRTTGNNIVGLSFYSTLLYDINVTGSAFTLNINRFPKGNTENNGTSIGRDADVTAKSSYGVAIGYRVKSNGYNAIAIGNYVEENEQLSINIGDRLKVSDKYGLSYWDGTDMRNLKEQLDSKQNVLTIDTAMSDTSGNAVQNKVIKAYIDSLVGNILTQLQEINGTN